ncbi:MAG: sugar phosphate isomerase/epimerase [Lentisphaerae bacterium]|nr:sugar phosphate isomerase/epimerase [Lentisphaerota bacterium]
MKPGVALQLYSVREPIKKSGYEATVRSLAAMGYAGVEPAGFPGTTAEAAGKLFRELGLAVPSAHVPIPVGDAKQQTLDTMQAIGSTRMVSGLGPDDFKTLDRIKASCATFNEAAANASAAGMTFGIHNHWWEFGTVDGRLAYEIMLDLLTPAVFFEVDTYWVKTAGVDPVDVVRKLGKRAPLLHIKDGPAVMGQPMTAVGDGVLDFHAIAKASTAAEWMIVELDTCATDMMDAVRRSYTYLTGQHLASGRR